MRWVRGGKRITLKESVRFHGHLGPYLILGILMGEYALKNLRAKKYSGLEVKIKGADKKPKSCIVDGLQLSTGATLGKGNICKLNGKDIRVIFYNVNSRKNIMLSLKPELKIRLAKLKSHQDSEILAKKLYKTKDYVKLFRKLTTKY